MGRRREFDNPDLIGMRSWRVKRFPKYLIFYIPIEDGVEIVRVLHGARNLEAIFRRP